MKYKVFAISFALFISFSSAYAASYYLINPLTNRTYTNQSSSTKATSTPPLGCVASSYNVYPNDKVLFSPKTYGGFMPSKYEWIGQSTTTSNGPVLLAFSYPGKYKVVLKAIGWDGGYAIASCDDVSVDYSNNHTTSTTSPAKYLFNFTSTTTRALIPEEETPLPSSCLNLGQDLSYGYSDDVINPKTGVIYKLQQFLKDFGFLKLNPSGYFGTATKSAVIAFQKSAGISQTGYVGKLTREAIKQKSCQQ